MGALAKAREAYEQTPREIDGDLVRKARGDRGCLGDAISGFGAVATVACGLLASLSILPLGFAFVGVGILVVGFVVGSVSQSKSGKERTHALESGPLVGGHVIRMDDYLGVSGRRSGRVTVLFTTDPAARFDAKVLRKCARRLAHRVEQLEQQGGAERDAAWVKLAKGTETFGFESVPDSVGEGIDLWLADVVVYPDLLEDNKLSGEGATLPVIVDPASRFIEHV